MIFVPAFLTARMEDGFIFQFHFRRFACDETDAHLARMAFPSGMANLVAR